MMLKAEAISASYGRVKVLKDIDMSVESGEIVCLVGANGAGKSTLLKVISGIVPAGSGKFLFEGQDITNKKPDFIVKAGLSHVPEGRQIFADLTVRQNLILGSYVHNLPKQEMAKLFDSVFELFPVLKSRLMQKAGTMSGGEQQMLAIGRGLMSQPKLLLLDEPSLGLAPLVVETILKVIQNLRSTGISILLVEQNVNAALQISDRAYVIETGAIVTEGKARELMENDEIKKSYLGM
ncbi:MAG TPA: ABC transporter ATP-binding protein [Syntrophorhabdus sp.]|nr:ABC transporter ATP-binding protein [Syntrophorhabdus sp.]OPX96383.1 MAG: High-affinity branched-chain amino acid transport ATP-binding protein LivF [Syntrophorhabdus sp. PtaB.Bin027]OQB74733.1 MAG: High-affinity branched-chain amino acid transport ATP-binding protein LivF [Deltaproteobacteria bacterium ADurb.Bin135]HNQ47377.1 ABC transporter ATP-binding protein [Syntrophorhabdus sp.]HNS79355.1 ABC transporter ATP-binding protein [Syntrophorhabdus sp.]